MTQIVDRTPHPRIVTFGRVYRDDEGALVLSGFTVGLCIALCPCHLNPFTRQPVLLSDAGDGLLGLRSFRLVPCGCCVPWRADELERVSQDLMDIAGIVSMPPKT